MDHHPGDGDDADDDGGNSGDEEDAKDDMRDSLQLQTEGVLTLLVPAFDCRTCFGLTETRPMELGRCIL